MPVTRESVVWDVVSAACELQPAALEFAVILVAAEQEMMETGLRAHVVALLTRLGFKGALSPAGELVAAALSGIAGVKTPDVLQAARDMLDATNQAQHYDDAVRFLRIVRAANLRLSEPI